MAGDLPDPRSIRIAENEAGYRGVNERLEGDVRRYAEPGERFDFVCECGNETCDERVSLSIDEYEAVRRDSRTFVVVSGHEIPDVEDVVAVSDGHSVVRKHAETAPIVEGTDARREA